jgi:hypothetical protein
LPLKDRIRPLLKASPRTVADLADHLDANTETVRTTLKRRSGRLFVPVPGTEPTKWALAAFADGDQTRTRQVRVEDVE